MKIVLGFLLVAAMISAALFLRPKISSDPQESIPLAEESSATEQHKAEDKAPGSSPALSPNPAQGSNKEEASAQEPLVQPEKPEVNPSPTPTPSTTPDGDMLPAVIPEKHQRLAEKATFSQPFPLRWEKATPVRDKTFFSEKLAGVFEGPVLLTNGKRSHILSIETGGNAQGEAFDGTIVMKMRKPDGTALGETTVNGEISQHFKEDKQAKILFDVSKSQGRFYYEFDSVSRERVEGFVWRKMKDGAMVLHGTFILDRKE